MYICKLVRLVNPSYCFSLYIFPILTYFYVKKNFGNFSLYREHYSVCQITISILEDYTIKSYINVLLSFLYIR